MNKSFLNGLVHCLFGIKFLEILLKCSFDTIFASNKLPLVNNPYRYYFITDSILIEKLEME